MPKRTTKEYIKEAQENLALALLARDPVVNGMSTEDPPPPPSPPVAMPMDGYMIVGKASAPPGGVAVVTLTGGTNFETRGFAIGIGMSPEVEFLKAASGTADELEDILEIDRPMVIAKQQKGGRTFEQYIQLGVVFMRTVGDTLTMDPAAPGVATKPRRTIEHVEILQMTPLFQLHLKVPETAKPGDRFELDVETLYGHKLFSNGPWKRRPWFNMYNTRRLVSPTGFYPTVDQMVSGWIDVVEG